MRRRLTFALAALAALVVVPPARAGGDPLTYVTDAATQRYGGGAFAGSITWDRPMQLLGDESCNPATATVSISADIALTSGVSSFAGPVLFTGTGTSACGPSFGSMIPTWSVSGTDVLGSTFHCAELRGLLVWTFWWTGGLAGPCTLNGVAMPGVQFVPEGQYVPTGLSSGTVAGALWVNSY